MINLTQSLGARAEALKASLEERNIIERTVAPRYDNVVEAATRFVH